MDGEPGGIQMEQININTTIDTLRNFELTVALLYETFSQVFPSDRFKWQAFAEEERMHAKWLAGLKIYHSNKIVSLNETKITIHSINKAIEFLQEQIDKARNHTMDIREAVSTAMYVEASVIENSFLKIFSFDTPKGRAVQERLIRETQIHRDKMALWQLMLEEKEQMVAC